MQTQSWASNPKRITAWKKFIHVIKALASSKKAIEHQMPASQLVITQANFRKGTLLMFEKRRNSPCCGTFSNSKPDPLSSTDPFELRISYPGHIIYTPQGRNQSDIGRYRVCTYCWTMARGGLFLSHCSHHSNCNIWSHEQKHGSEFGVLLTSNWGWVEFTSLRPRWIHWESNDHIPFGTDPCNVHDRFTIYTFEHIREQT